jgi:hypothetical protein
MPTTSRLADSRALRLSSALVGLLVPAVWIALILARPDEALRLRMALTSEVGQAADFDWQPDAMPRSFLQNAGPVPKPFADAATRALADLTVERSSLAVGVSFAKLLMSAPRRTEDPIRSDAATTLRGIVSDGRGYCADFVRVFNGLAISARVPVREWGFAFNAFGSGHAFNEVFDQTRRKWVMVDSFHSLLFVDPATREPLSVLEVHDRLLSLDPARAEVAIQRIVPGRFQFRSEALAIDYYRRGMPQLFLVWGNSVFDYERAIPVRIASHVSRAAAQFVGIALGYYPRVRIYPIGLSERDLNELSSRGAEFLVAVMVQIVALVVCGLETFVVLRRRHPSGR